MGIRRQRLGEVVGGYAVVEPDFLPMPDAGRDVKPKMLKRAINCHHCHHTVTPNPLIISVCCSGGSFL